MIKAITKVNLNTSTLFRILEIAKAIFGSQQEPTTPTHRRESNRNEFVGHVRLGHNTKATF